MLEIDSRERFSNRVADYVKFRPSYPAKAVDFLLEKTAVSPRSAIVDCGSGTGKFTALLLERGLPVLALEPNANMRKAAEQDLCRYPGFCSASARAEDTGLPGTPIINHSRRLFGIYLHNTVKTEPSVSRIKQRLLWEDGENRIFFPPPFYVTGRFVMDSYNASSCVHPPNSLYPSHRKRNAKRIIPVFFSCEVVLQAFVITFLNP